MRIDRCGSGMLLTSLRQLVPGARGGHAEGLGEAAVRGRCGLAVLREVGRPRPRARAHPPPL